MFSNYIRVAIRNIGRYKLFSFINIFGLALSLSFCLLVIMIITDQTSFDSFHPRGEDTYRILTNAQRKNGNVESYASSPFPLGDIVGAESPAVENVAHVVRGLSSEAEVGVNRISIQGFFAGSSFFDVFGFTLEKGIPGNALELPQTIVLTKEAALKIFGEKEAMGSTVTFRGLGEFVVTGILAPRPGKSHLEFDALGSLSSLPVLEQEEKIRPILTDWKNYYSNYTYLRLKAGKSSQELQPLLASAQDRFYGELELESRDKGYTFELQPLGAISPGRLLSQSTGRALPEVVLLFLASLALVGMVGALFNYTNLTLARSLARAKEIGLRKVVGANRRQLFVQFLSESVFMSVAALLLGLVILQSMLVPGFETLQIAEGSDITLAFSPLLVTIFAGFAIIIGIIAGLIPAAVMSGFRPALVLRDISRIRVFSGLTLRKVLLVLQFMLSIVLFIAITVMQRQVSYAMTMDYGFDWHGTMTVRLQGQDASRVAQQFAQHPNVESVAAMSHHPLTWEDWKDDVRVNPTDEPLGVRLYGVDANFVDLFHLSFVAGENFHNDLPRSNERLVLVNEKFLEKFKLGTPNESIGHSLVLGDSNEVRIAGVLRDFFYKPATYTLEPMILTFAPKEWNVLAIRLRSGDVASTKEAFEETWKKLDPYHPLVARTYDEILEDVYDVPLETVAIVGSLGVLVFAISILGLLGIVTFQVESRVKEIGIRRVLGAGTRSLLVLLARKELILLLVSTALAVPAGLIVSNAFLEQFAHRIALGAFDVLPAVFVVYLCAVTTIVLQSIRATVANPVDVLKYE